MSNYIVKQGDTVSGILSKLGFHGKALRAECITVQKINKLDANYTIFIGKTLVLPDGMSSGAKTDSVWTSKPVNSKNPTTGQESQPVVGGSPAENQGEQPPALDSQASVTGQSQNSNLGKIDKYFVDNVISTQLAEDDVNASNIAFMKAHPGELRSPADIKAELVSKLSAIDNTGVNLIKPEDATAFVNGNMSVEDLYYGSFANAAKDSIKNVKDLDGDSTTMNREEFEAEQKEIQTQITFGRMDRSNKDHASDGKVSYEEFAAYYLNTHPDELGVPSALREKFNGLAKDKGGVDLNDVRSNFEMFGVNYDKTAVDKAFDAIDQSGEDGKKDGKIDYRELASVYAAMDGIESGKNGPDGILMPFGMQIINKRLGLYSDVTGNQNDNTLLSECSDLFKLYKKSFDKY